MKRTLLVDTNRAAYPIYQALTDLGHEVWVVGGKPNETLAKLAKHYRQLDYSDRDALSAFINEKQFDYLVPGCTDLSYLICAEMNEMNDRRFPGIESVAKTRAVNTKSTFRDIAQRIGLPAPKLLSLAEGTGARSVIVKPVDSFSGRGMTILHSPSLGQLTKACETARKYSKSGVAIVEEFASGQLYSHSAFIQDGTVTVDFIVQEDCVTNPFTVDTSRVDYDFPPEMIAALRSDVLRLASSLQLTDGLMHTQFINREGKYWIIEMTRRCPGDIYSLLIEFSTGYPYALAYAAPFIEAKAPLLAANPLRELIIRHTATSKGGSSLWGYRFACPVEIRLFVPLATAGDYIEASPYGRSGIFFLRAGSVDEQDTLYRMLLTGELYTFNGKAANTYD